ncbi:MAG: cytidylate kinase-like family protein [Absicoccus sp.]|uniref:Cytidylate kinase-like family protein n=1 Tax=Absicoccus intestinalis TaxID=2926319 RepID=A0ABU4WKD3_9FIRM|nr:MULTISPECIES: cytidylate kinase-like family protein [unclassified Absicoccus]MDX8417019.1 cytidylate kinase-like family protein [Absicoccus sp. CLA-KB-P134]MDY3036182.1 cytidylate kinase-like family protein [Absicoccus sp.]
MEKNIIITVGCEYGSGGPEIGEIISKDFGIAYYDRSIIDKIIEETGMSTTLVEAAETGQEVKGRSRELESSASPTKYQVLTDRVVYIQTQIIKKLADRGPCVFVGRCADYVLKDRENVLNVFVYAPYDVRLKKVIDTLHISQEAAEYRVKTQGKQLHARYEQMTGTYRGDRHNRHLLIDSSVLGIEETAKFIEEFANRVLEKRD